MADLQFSDGPAVSSQDLISVLSTSPHEFLQPTPALHSATISALKTLLDPLASDINDVQTRRRDEARKKRKRTSNAGDEEEPLHIKRIYTDGFGVPQIWAQAKRILDAAQAEVTRGLAELEEFKRLSPPSLTNDGAHKPKTVRFDAEVDSMSEDEGALEDDLSSLDEAGYDDEDSEDIEAEHMDGIADEALNEAFSNDEGALEDESEEHEGNATTPSATFVQDPNGLNDGFFSIDDFNRQSQFLEQQDARGDPDDGAASDEEEIDWDADPLTYGQQAAKKPGDRSKPEDSGSEGSDEDGPTFGNVDLDAESNDDAGADAEEGLHDMASFTDTSGIKYKDFFDPPARKPSKTKRMRALPKTQPPQASSEDDMRRAVSDVRRDLFDEPSDREESEDDGDEQLGAASNLSSHEKRRMKVVAEIRRLEAAAVTKRDWTLSGEASATDRPINSLIEEDLEFERTGKPVPVITQEVSEEIETLIKRRILAQEFDEIVRRRPAVSGGTNGDAAGRRGRIELDDNKPKESLSSIYEADYVRQLDPKAYSDGLSSRLQKEHAEIHALWKDISSKLDLLSNWNYRPKVPEANVTVVNDAPTISMEDARPGIAAGLSGDPQSNDLLAPQEIYAPGQNARKGSKGQVKGANGAEVLLKSGHSLSKEEMTRENKSRRRRREKSRQKKQLENERANPSTGKGDGQNKRSQSQASAPLEGTGRKRTGDLKKKNIIDDLKKGNVKVIGRSGELTDVQGQRTSLAQQPGQNGTSSASALKL